MREQAEDRRQKRTAVKSAPPQPKQLHEHLVRKMREQTEDRRQKEAWSRADERQIREQLKEASIMSQLEAILAEDKANNPKKDARTEAPAILTSRQCQSRFLSIWYRLESSPGQARHHKNHRPAKPTRTITIQYEAQSEHLLCMAQTIHFCRAARLVSLDRSGREQKKKKAKTSQKRTKARLVKKRRGGKRKARKGKASVKKREKTKKRKKVEA